MSAHAAAYHVAVPAEAIHLRLGGYTARIGSSPDIRRDALALRGKVFRNGARDEDRFDAACLHGTVGTASCDMRVAFRARLIPSVKDLAQTYTGQFYDLSDFDQSRAPFLELGRVCQADGPSDIMALRLAWAALGALVDAQGVGMMLGCSSLQGANPERHSATLAALRAHHLGPVAWRPGRKAQYAIDLPKTPGGTAVIPPLLRSYLNMGGWVGDHAVPDTYLDTLHVFTGLRIDAIPEPRKRRLRALALTAQATPLDVVPAAP
ncbi:MAG: GNAT family N-acyltransferase [Marivita sp.]|uniref:GNAT family N-acyltransferase n=1 Tax=Marivita sp. TaxID=2003365 RepID=UPI003EF186FC